MSSSMKKHFYSHLIELEPILTTLDEIVISDKNKKELLSIVEITTHYLVTDVVLSELPEADKKKFLHFLARNEHSKIWNLISKKIDNIEDKIRIAIRDVHLSMIDDARKISKKKK